MPRYTSNIQEVKKLSDINLSNILTSALVRVELANNTIIEGAVRNISMGNNATEAVSGRDIWRYYGEITVETLSRQMIKIDLLDTVNIESIPINKFM